MRELLLQQMGNGQVTHTGLCQIGVFEEALLLVVLGQSQQPFDARFGDVRERVGDVEQQVFDDRRVLRVSAQRLLARNLDRIL